MIDSFLPWTRIAPNSRYIKSSLVTFITESVCFLSFISMTEPCCLLHDNTHQSWSPGVFTVPVTISWCVSWHPHCTRPTPSWTLLSTQHHHHHGNYDIHTACCQLPATAYLPTHTSPGIKSHCLLIWQQWCVESYHQPLCIDQEYQNLLTTYQEAVLDQRRL